jgi:hypothetical protein
VLDEAVRTVGRDVEARALITAGEAAFADGDLAAAAHSFMAAAERMPTSATAWSNLAVALHALDNADAGEAVEHAVFLAPDARTPASTAALSGWRAVTGRGPWPTPRTLSRWSPTTPTRSSCSRQLGADRPQRSSPTRSAIECSTREARNG